MDLESVFQDLNAQHFDGFLDPPILRWNTRLRSSAGRFMPGSRKYFQQFRPAIEIARYLLSEPTASELVRDTLGHEMIHYWLWVRRRPYGHTPEFYAKMNELGVSRYNSVPRPRPYKYVYRCPGCLKEFNARRRLGVLACALCCKAFAGGRYDPRFKLTLTEEL